MTTPRAHDEGPRDWFGEVVPFAAAATIAWWTTVRPAGWFPGAPAPARWSASAALVGLAVAVVALAIGARPTRRAGAPSATPPSWALTFLAFIVPSTAAWLLGPEQSTSLLEPVELFVGALAWVAIGVLLIRPQSVVAPDGAEGDRGPSIGAGDDAARWGSRAFDESAEPPPALTARHAMPRWASLPLWIAGAAIASIAYQLLAVSSNVPERAVLARACGAAAAIALFGAAGDLAEVRYLSRARPRTRTRFQRATLALLVVAVALVLGWLLFPKTP
jgi:hypothetical protein